MYDSVKDEVFLMLDGSRGKSLSGESMAARLGVSRNAVWKAVKALENEGYLIESRRNKGYMLRGEADRLSAAAIRAALEKEKIEVFFYDSIDSTNNEAKRLLANGLQGDALIVAEEQTKGRGRLGRDFYSPSGSGVYMTLVLRPQAELRDAVTLTAAAAVAVVETIESLSDKRPLIKWVNDVYLDGKKICGILTEAVSDFETGSIQGVLIGIGVNMKTADFPRELQKTASSLDAKNVTRCAMIAGITRALIKACADLGAREYLSSYRAHSMVIGKEVKYFQNGEAFFALATGIDDSGGLIVRHADGAEKTLHSGEITLRIV